MRCSELDAVKIDLYSAAWTCLNVSHAADAEASGSAAAGCSADASRDEKSSGCKGQEAKTLGNAQVSYAIGVAQPLSVHVDTYATGTKPDKEILASVLKAFDFRPGTLPACLQCCRFTSRLSYAGSHAPSPWWCP